MISTKLSVGVTKKGKFGTMLPPLPLDQIEIVMSSQRSNRSRLLAMILVANMNNIILFLVVYFSHRTSARITKLV